MIVRLADPERDALAIFDGARDFISRMDFTAWLPETDADLVAAVGRLVSCDDMEVVVAEQDTRIVGGVGVMFLPCDWNPGLILAVEKFLWCAPDAPKTTLLRLLRFVRDRMRVRGATMMEFGALTSSPERLGRIYRRLGMRPVQTMWIGAA